MYFIGIYARSGDVGPKLDAESRLWILSTLLAIVDNLERYIYIYILVIKIKLACKVVSTFAPLELLF